MIEHGMRLTAEDCMPMKLAQDKFLDRFREYINQRLQKTSTEFGEYLSEGQKVGWERNRTIDYHHLENFSKRFLKQQEINKQNAGEKRNYEFDYFQTYFHLLAHIRHKISHNEYSEITIDQLNTSWYYLKEIARVINFLDLEKEIEEIQKKQTIKSSINSDPQQDLNQFENLNESIKEAVKEIESLKKIQGQEETIKKLTDKVAEIQLAYDVLLGKFQILSQQNEEERFSPNVTQQKADELKREFDAFKNQFQKDQKEFTKHLERFKLYTEKLDEKGKETWFSRRNIIVASSTFILVISVIIWVNSVPMNAAMEPASNNQKLIEDQIYSLSKKGGQPEGQEIIHNLLSNYFDNSSVIVKVGKNNTKFDGGSPEDFLNDIYATKYFSEFQIRTILLGSNGKVRTLEYYYSLPNSAQ